MGQADFYYESGEAGRAALADTVRDAATDPAGVPLAVSIFADRAHLRETMRDDVEAAGFRPGTIGDLADLLGSEARSLGEIVLLDCPAVQGATLAALTRLDMRGAPGCATGGLDQSGCAGRGIRLPRSVRCADPCRSD